MPLPHRLRHDSQTGAARMGPLAQGDHDGLRGLSPPPETDVIDLYQVHMQDRNVAIDETLRALDDLVTEGKVRYIGCANYAGYSLVESLWAADRLQAHRYESVQLQWSLVRRSAERELIPAAAAFADRWEEAGVTLAELSEQLLMTAKGIKTSVDTLSVAALKR